MLCLYRQNGHPYLKNKLWSKRSSYFSVKDSATSNSVIGRLNPWLKRKGEREEWKRGEDEREMEQLRENLYITYTVKWSRVLYRVGKGKDRQRSLNGVICDKDLAQSLHIRNWKWELSCCHEYVIFKG